MPGGYGPGRNGNRTGMAITLRRPDQCDGFRVESANRLVGWVEETWLGPSGEPAALAVRSLDGRRALVLRDDVDVALAEDQTVVLCDGAALLELDAPRIESGGDGAPPTAAWRATGAVLEPPAPPGFVRSALIARRPWRLAPPPADPRELAVWKAAVVLYAAIVVVAAIVIALAFLVPQAV